MQEAGLHWDTVYQLFDIEANRLISPSWESKNNTSARELPVQQQVMFEALNHCGRY